MDSRLSELAVQLMEAANAGALDPAKIGATLLPHLFILDIERDKSGKRTSLRVRLTGTSIDRIFGRVLAGRALEEFVHGPRGDRVIQGFHDCADRSESLWMRQIVKIKERAPRFIEGIAVPLASARICGGLVAGDYVVSAPSFETFERRSLAPPRL